MSNTANVTLEGQVLTVNPQNVSYLAEYTDGNKAVVLTNGKKYYVTNAEYEAISNLDYSGGGGGSVEGAITSDTISNMEFSEGVLNIDGTEFQGGSAMVYNTTTNKLSGAKDQNGNDVELDFGTITIQF